jgi:hypothetical protein
LFRHRNNWKPSKPTIAIVATGIGVVLAASSAAAVTWPSGAPTGAATTAAYVSPVGNASHINEQSQLVNPRLAWQAQMTAAAQARRAAARAAARKAAARKAAARKAAAKRASARRAAELAAQQEAAQPPARSQASAPPAPAPVQPSGSPQHIAMAMLGSFGWSPGQFGCLDSLWSRESGWNVTASNPDGAYGIPQAMPGSKMSSAGPDWQTDATTQIRWGLGYIKDLYGSPCGAWSHEEATGWY